MVAVSGPPARAPVTVVITQQVRPERSGDFCVWQEEVNHAVAQFAGFLGTEFVEPPQAGETTILYRFDSALSLEAWLTSSTRQDLLEQAASLLAAPARQQVLVGKRDEDLITVVISHRVRPDQAEAFRTFQDRMTAAERAFPGFRGADLFPPVPAVQEDWTAIYRFDSSEHLDAWLQSPQRSALLADAEEFGDFDLHRVSSPFGSWFSLSDDGPDIAVARPWKTALSVLVGLYPTVVLLTLGISELFPHADLWWSLLLGNVLSVSLLTWVVMPIVTRVLGFWLVPARATGLRLDRLGAAVSIGFLTAAAAVFWLVTTVLWKLP